MSKFMISLKNKYNKLSKMEKKVADYIISSSQGEVPLYITDLATASETSETTIVRFAKKLGFNGYRDLKIALAQDGNLRPINQNISENDSTIDIFYKVCEDIYCSLEKTKTSLDANALQRCCNSILSAKKIIVLGLGNSASVATDVAHKLLRLGFNVSAYTDNHLQSIAVSNTDDQCVVIGISHSGRSADVVQSLQTAKDNNATTMCITNLGKSPIDKVSDIILHTHSDETNYRILGLSSRIAQLAIVDAIYSYLVCHVKNSEERITLAESALRQKKIK